MYLAVIIVLLTITYLFLRLRKYSEVNKLPGPAWWELIQNLVLSNPNKDLYKYLTSLNEKYGPVVKIWIKPFKPTLLIADKRYFEEILGSKEHLHKTKLYDMLHILAGNGLTTIKDLSQWKFHRKLLNNVFNQTAVSNYTPKLKYHADKLKTLLESENKPVDVHDVVYYTTLYIILEYLTDDIISEEVATKFIQVEGKCLEIMLERGRSLYKTNEFLFKFTPNYNSWRENCKILHSIFANILEEQIQKIKNNKLMEINDGKKNFINVLLENELSLYSVLSQVKTFILAGFDTVATAIGFALYEIAQREDIQEKILEEYLLIVGNNNLTFDDLQNMTYIEAVIKETMRLHPPIPLIERKLKTPLEIDGFKIPADIDLIFSIPSLHNMNFSRPEVFDPERFSLENFNNIDNYVYAPFSHGPRDCIGRRFAMIEMKYIVAYVVRHFSLHSIEPKHKLELTGDFVLRSKNGLPVIFKRRKLNT